MALEAAKAGVSVIASTDFTSTNHMQEMVTSYPETTPSGIGEALLLVYKNEKLKAERSQNGLLFIQNTRLAPTPILFKAQ